LFNICQPDVAVFGQKDYQQLVVLRQMVHDLHMPVKVLAGPTKRAENGLALSSRNQYLNAEQKDQAGALYATLSAAGAAIAKGRSDWAELEAEGLRQLESAGFVPDYFAVRRAVNLSHVEAAHQNLVVLAAAQLGDVRLIDNILVARPA
jgi:pantoate--beta-alanine ligase